MRLPLITPTVVPSVGGTCTFVATTGGEDPNWPSGLSRYQFYTYTGHPAAGYRLVQFKFVENVSIYDGDTEETYPSEHEIGYNYIHDNSYAVADHPSAYTIQVPGAVWSYEYEGTGIEVWVSSLTVEAVFERYYIPTHLLVNSANKSTPVQLVYDPTTNLLVADY